MALCESCGILLYILHPTNIINAKVCEDGCMFVTLSRKNYWTDFDETLQEPSLYIGIRHRLQFIKIL